MDKKIKYRNGYPSKKSIGELIEGFFGSGFLRIRASEMFPNTGALIWDTPSINDKIPGFIEYLKAHGIYAEGDWNPYDTQAAAYGKLIILKPF